MALTLNGSNNTIAGLAVGGVPDNTIDNGCLADDAVGIADLSATGTASATTFLRGDNSWATAGEANPCGKGTFKAYRNTDQTATSDAYTRIQFNAEEWDTENWFDSTTNHRFTPQVAGYYHINVQCIMLNFANHDTEFHMKIQKNGSDASYYYNGTGNGGHNGYQTRAITTAIQMNGSSDYLDAFVYFWNTGGNETIKQGKETTFFTGHLIKAT